MSDLATQLVDYLDETAPAVGLEEIFAEPVGTLPVRPLAPRRVERHVPGWVYAVAVAAAILLLVGGVTWLLRPQATVAPTDQPATTTPPIDPSSSFTWSRVPYDETIFGGEYEQGMASVTVGGPGLVAVGGADADAAVWTSPDGIAWSRVPHNEAVFGEAQMASVIAGGPGLVAVGLAWGTTVDGAAVWTSADGVTWSRVPDNEAVFGGGATMWSVTAGGPGLVAVGWDGHPHGERGNAVVWTSADGVTWSRVPDNEAVFGEESGQWMWSVTAGGPGLVAVGMDSSGAAVWTSPDGTNWSKVPHNKAVFGEAEMRSVTVGGSGLVAVGSAWGTTVDGAAVWTSPDGIAWSRVPHNEAVFGEAGMSSVTVADAGLVAVGGADAEAAVWTSPDGIAWSRVPHNEAVFGGRFDVEARSVTVGGPGLVAVGADGRDGNPACNCDAAVWVAVPEE